MATPCWPLIGDLVDLGAFATPLGAIVRPARDPGCFLILIGSYAFFWHTRDWNTASRLMLTYAIVDRGTVTITGLDQQTNDKAWFQGQYYSDKLPGFPLLATVPYGIAKAVLRLPSHPLNQPAFPYWDADYWSTLGTSGLFTALTALLLLEWARELGCSSRRGVLIALAYGLATPAYVYATIAYGHQTSAFALFASFYLLWKRKPHCVSSVVGIFPGRVSARRTPPLIELQVGPVSAILGLYLLSQCLRGVRRPDALSLFAVGAMIPTLILLTYNQLAFGSPWDMGYFHHATDQFAKVHSTDNRLGLRVPDHPWRLLAALLWGRYRGLTFYAPILLLTVPGWAVLMGRKCWGAGGRDVHGGRRDSARECVLSRVDRRLVDRPAATRSCDSVCHAARGCSARRGSHPGANGGHDRRCSYWHWLVERS